MSFSPDDIFPFIPSPSPVQEPMPWFFAWVDETDNVFDQATMLRMDEQIYDLNLDHQEGQIPTLDLTIKNPRVGLLTPNRKVWAWFGYNDGLGHVTPLFFGVLVGIPNSLFKEVIQIRLIARSPNYIAQKQAVAEALKIAPYYDPIWFDDAHRDDPDSILEGWSAFYHVDRVTQDVSASDVLIGEDGHITFDEGMAIYESVDMQLGQPPITNIRVEATVNWTQRTAGYFPVPAVNIASYTGDSFMSDWPKAGAAVGGGYSVTSSFVSDNYHVNLTPDTTFQSSWNNTDPNILQCAQQHNSSSSSGPALLSPNPLSCVLTEGFTTGICDPYSDPPQNVPATTSATGFIVPLWSLTCTMNMRYDVNRQYSEVLAFDLTCNTQAVLTSPLISQDTELLTLTGADVGQPLVQPEAWTDFADQEVSVAQVVYPNNPTVPGGLSYQIAVRGGKAGLVEPDFSDIPGTLTADGTVLWASVGTSPPSVSGQWASGTAVPPGQIVLVQNQTFNTASGQFEFVPNSGSYYMALNEGYTNETYTTMTYIPDVSSNDDPTPEPVTISYIVPPEYSETVGQQISDGSVTWMVLGTDPSIMSIPIGGTAMNVQARCFFPTDRGQISVQHLVCRARARIRFRARAVTVKFDTPIENVFGLSCRMNATIYDGRIPGGAATGKIIGYSMTADGEGKMLGHVTIGVAVGYGNSVPEITGTPEYAADGYMDDGYQVFDGQFNLTADNDLSYTAPAFSTFDDGLTFPIQFGNISDGGTFSGNLTTQIERIEASFAVAQRLQYLQAWANIPFSFGAVNSQVSGVSISGAWDLEREELALASSNTPYVMAETPISWSCVMKPCSGNGPFSGSYSIDVSPLEVPMGVNLLAHSSD